MFFKHHHPKIIIAIAVIAIFIATFAYKRNAGADLSTNLTWCSANVGSIGIPLSECQGLAHLYNETSGDNWVNNSNWFVNTNLTTWGPLNAIIINGGHVVRLTLNNNNLSGAIVTGLDTLIWLTGLNMSANYISAVDLSNNLLLEEVGLLTNRLSTIDVSTNTLLKRLYVGANMLTSLNVSNNSQLILLHAGSNQLSGINLSNNGLMQELYLFNNDFTWYDTSTSPALRLFNISQNDLTGLDISQSPGLNTGYFYNNQLTYLDTTSNTQLRLMWLMNNDLTGINLQNNTVLTELLLDFNQLTGLDISHNTGLIELNTRGNGIRTLTVANAGDYPLASSTNYYFSGNNLCYLETVSSTGLNRVTFLNQQDPVWMSTQFCEPENFAATPTTNSVTLNWGTPDGYFDVATSDYVISIDGGAAVSLTGAEVSYTTGLNGAGQHAFKICARTLLDVNNWPAGVGVCAETVATLLQGGGGGGGGGSDDGYGGGLEVDECPNGDLSGSPFDHDCGAPEPEPDVVVTEIDPEEPMLPAPSLPDNTTILPDGALNCANPVSQYNEAFEFAFQYGITSMPTCAKAYMNGKLIRKDAAKMIVNFVKNIMGRQPDRSIHCEFTDMYGAHREAQKYAIEACQLGLMGLRGDGSPASKFRPDAVIDKKQFSTIVSRILFGDTYNTATNNKRECWYCNHVNALWNAGIIKTTSGLNEQFNRGFAFIMLMRAVKEH